MSKTKDSDNVILNGSNAYAQGASSQSFLMEKKKKMKEAEADLSRGHPLQKGWLSIIKSKILEAQGKKYCEIMRKRGM